MRARLRNAFLAHSYGRRTHRRQLVARPFVVSLVVAFCALAAPPTARGEDSRDDIELRRQDQQLQDLRRRQEGSPDVRLQPGQREAVERLPEQEATCYVLREIRSEGDPTLSALVDAALAGDKSQDPPFNRCLGARGIDILLRRGTNALIGGGFVTSRVEAMPQDMRAGELVLTIRPGRIEDIRYAGDGPSPSPVGAPLGAATGDLLNLRDIEQTLENLRRNMGADANIDIEPGTIDDQSIVVIHYTQPPRFGFVLGLDDSGGTATGRWQSSATFNWNSPLGLSDLLYVSASKHLPVSGHEAPHGSNSEVLHYSVPIGYWLVGTTLSSSDYEQTLPGGLRNRYIGHSENGELQVQRVVHRSAYGKSTFGLKAFWRQSGNFINDEELVSARRRTGGWEASASYTRYLGAGSVDAQLSFRRGTGAFGALPAAEEHIGDGTSRMRIAQGSLSIWMPFEWESLAPVYSGQLRVQWNGAPVTAQDRFCIGGRYTVRGFDGEQSLCASRGQVLRNEVALALPGISSWRGYVGLDVGSVHGRSAPRDGWMAGGVLGMRASGLSPLGIAQIDVFVGKPLHKPVDFQTARAAAGVSITANF